MSDTSLEMIATEREEKEKPIELTQDQLRAIELNNIGAQLFSQGQYEPAKMHFLASISTDKENFQAWMNLGAVLRMFGQYHAAEFVAKRSILLSNNNVFAKSNLGVSQLSLRKFDEALRTLKDVVEETQEHGPHWHNYGLAHYMLGQYWEALASFERSLELAPDNIRCRSDYSLTLLSLGFLQKGLESYECRWELLWRSKVWALNILEWQGEDLDGKHILLHHEQGFGDTLMLSRFVRDILAKGAKITLAVPMELTRIMESSFPNISVIDHNLSLKTRESEFDFHSPLLSVVKWLGLEKPEQIGSEPYLCAQPMTPIKLPSAKVRIGLVWASGKHTPELEERRRIVPLVLFLPLLEIKDLAVISLQKDEGQADIARNGLEGLFYDISQKCNDFYDTASVIRHLDMIICVDSAVAHLAAGMGKDVIMLSPYTRCWRWWDNKTGKPWYNTIIQFHQAKDGSWNNAARGACRMVEDFVERHTRSTNETAYL